MRQEVPREEWSSFFEGFSRRHQGWLITLEVFEGDIVSRTPLKETPLVEIKPGLNSISVLTDDPLETYCIAAPVRVRQDQTERGADRFLEIESANRQTSRLSFRSVMLPELVDGII